MAKIGSYWREAATVILVARTKPTNLIKSNKSVPNFNYNILTLKRSAKSSFMPDRYVFPGGTISEADFDRQWIGMFEKYAKDSFKNIASSFQNRHVVAPLFQEKRQSPIPPEIAFRICAIRECFEECGVLLAKKYPKARPEHAKSVNNDNIFKLDNKLTESSAQTLTSRHLNSQDWRKRVHKDAGEFLTLCLEHGLVPDVWALNEWCNWLTPVMKQVSAPPERPKRFDTIFYVCCLEDIPSHVRVDGRETTVLKWESPGDYIQHFISRETALSEPQLYEMLRLCNFTSFDQLREYCAKRENKGMVQYLPVIMPCKDGFVNILPGDELYPSNPDINGTLPIQTLDQTSEELEKAGLIVNRTYHDEEGRPRITCNIPMKCDLVNPLVSLAESTPGWRKSRL